MGGFFNAEGGAMSTLNRITDALTLGILWLVCSLPIVTLGASTAAVYYAYHKSVRQRRGYAWKEFFHGFKSNFKQATLVWLIGLAAYFLIWLDCQMVGVLKEDQSWMEYLLPVMYATAIAITILLLYIFAYMARFSCTIKQLFVNTFLIAYSNFGWTILVVLLFAVGVVIALLIPVAVIIVPPVYVGLTNWIMERLFRKYMPEEVRLMEEEKDKEI